MSDTPRVDAKERETRGKCFDEAGDTNPLGVRTHSHYGWKTARTLERELAAKSAEATRLRDALEHLIERCDTSDDHRYGTLSTSFVRDIASEALSEAK